MKMAMWVFFKTTLVLRLLMTSLKRRKAIKERTQISIVRKLARDMRLLYM